MPACKSIQELEKLISLVAEHKQKALSLLFEDIESDIDSTNAFIRKQNDSMKIMIDDMNSLMEHETVLEKAQHMLFGGINANM